MVSIFLRNNPYLHMLQQHSKQVFVVFTDHFVFNILFRFPIVIIPDWTAAFPSIPCMR